ncbi:yae1 domain-containing protein 1-like [Heracleum sosnowskyi]|uniref:Yae1 domain-containing protein 1-like n=1 Tax=Heracleum sosnowskyi TaxID=360622 RepID=A0AAD8JBV6_9APIA|nr:yae1 domain-containing protein 1-like [Heracleum sosnowskyi]
MTSSIADELYSEILEQSNGEMGSKSTSLANHFNSSDSHEDDLWIEDGLSWNGSNNESEKESDLDREWQRRRDQFHTIGYRDGLMAGKEASAQEGFNTGFSESVFVGYKWGLVRGVSSALACLPDEVKKRLVKSEEQINNVEKQKDNPMPTSPEEKVHTSGSNGNLLETYYEDMQALILESPDINVHFEVPK